MKPATETALAGFSIDVANTKDTTFTAKYTAEVRDGYIGQTALVQMRMDF